MALVNITDIALLNNPARFDSPFEFDITLHLVARLKADLEFRLVYVGSSDSSEHDQVLDSVLVGPLEVGQSRFVLWTAAPQLSKIPPKDVLGVTVVILTAAYRGADFFNVGYYVNNEGDEEVRRTMDPSRISRDVLMSKSKVSKVAIDWN